MRQLARAWFAVGTQSIGGGTSTLFLIRRELVERYRWISARQFHEAWALSQLSPGIHLVAFAGLLGHRIAGLRGVAVSVGGMMVPAAAMTAVMTAAYGAVADQPLARAALSGMGPATAGMTLALAALTARDVRQHGPRVVVDVALAAAAFAVLMFTTASPVLVIVAGGAVGALLLRRERPTIERPSAS